MNRRNDILMNPRLPLAFILSGLLLLLYGVYFYSNPPPQTGQHSHTFEYSSAEFQYQLFLPGNYGNRRQKWPLILYLHGASLRGDNIDKVKKYGLPRKIDSEGDFPFLVLSPQCPPHQGWRDAGWMIDLLDKIIAEYAVDPKRVYLTGVSLGGGGTWYWAGKHPDRFAAIAPLCGYGDPEQAETLKDVPVWVFHGEKDRVVPVSVSEEMVNALRKAGGEVKFTKFPKAGHSIVEEVYSDDSLYKWFLKHRK